MAASKSQGSFFTLFLAGLTIACAGIAYLATGMGGTLSNPLSGHSSFTAPTPNMPQVDILGNPIGYSAPSLNANGSSVGTMLGCTEACGVADTDSPANSIVGVLVETAPGVATGSDAVVACALGVLRGGEDVP